MSSMGSKPSRRQALRSAALGVVGLPVIGQVGQNVALAGRRRPRFFSVSELALLDVVTELIIPTDDHSPGARTAEVAWEIDRRLADSDPHVDAKVRESWRDGLRRLDALARRTHKLPHFLRATPSQQVALLEKLAAAEPAANKTPEEAFFVALKAETARAYYGSEVGLIRDFEYKGNAYLQEFIGSDPAALPRRS